MSHDGTRPALNDRACARDAGKQRHVGRGTVQGDAGFGGSCQGEVWSGRYCGQGDIGSGRSGTSGSSGRKSREILVREKGNIGQGDIIVRERSRKQWEKEQCVVVP